jgi:hypothetical protein
VLPQQAHSGEFAHFILGLYIEWTITVYKENSNFTSCRKEFGEEGNVNKTKYMVISRDQDGGRN